MRCFVWLLSALSAVVFALALFLAIQKAYAQVNRCCTTIFPYQECSGCVLVSVDPLRYVNVGNRSASKCTPTSLSTNCDEASRVCFSVTNANAYSNSSCTNVIGVTNASQTVPQCDGVDDPCDSSG